MDNIVLYDEDARNLSTKVPARSVDVTVTSPPYWGIKDYGFPEQIGYKQTYEQYLEDLSSVFRSVYETTKSSGSLWIIIDTVRTKEGDLVLLPFDLARTIGWQLIDIIIWDKKKSLPARSRERFRKTTEYILFFSKSKKYKFYKDRVKDFRLSKWWVKWPERYNPTGKSLTNIWDFTIPTQGSWGKYYLTHYCPFPLDLVEQMLLLTSDEDDVVMDPFAGSGTTLAVAKCMGRKAIGFEKNKSYLADFEQKVLPEIEREFSQRQQSFGSFTPEQLTERIEQLKRVKYAKLLAKQLTVNNPRMPLNSVLLVTRDGRRDEIYLVLSHAGSLDSSFHLDDFNKANGMGQATKSLIRFKISPKVYLMERSQFIEKMGENLRNEVLYLYRNPNMWERSLKFREWVKLSANKQVGREPFLLSTLSVYQKEVDLR